MPNDIYLRVGVGDRPVVAITGSFAKTSTKDMLAGGLSREFNVVKNMASLNVVDGIQSTLRRVQPDTDVVVQELGASGPGTLDGLLVRTLPTVGVITRIADDHWSAFKSREAVLKEKFKMVQALPQNGVAVLNHDDPLLRSRFGDVHCRLVTFGTDPDADVVATDVSAVWPDTLCFTVKIAGESLDVRTQLLGCHNLTCALAAVATAWAMGADMSRFVSSMGDVAPIFGRMQPLIRQDGINMIADYFKASPYSIDDILTFLREARANNSVLVAGQFSDTNKKAGRLARSIERRCLENGVKLVLIGEENLQFLRREEFGFDGEVGVFNSVIEVGQFLEKFCSNGDLILLKSSSNRHLERIWLMEMESVRCAALACGRKGFCGKCEHIGKHRGVEFKV